MLRNQVLEQMKTLKLHGMLAVYDEVVAAGLKARSTPEKIILELLKAEMAERHLRGIRYRMNQAKFPVAKDLDSFQFNDSAVDETQIRALYEGGQVY